MVRYSMYLSQWLCFINFKKRVWCRLSLTSMELKCKELKTCLLLFIFDNYKFKSIQNHLNPLIKWVNSTSVEKRSNSFDGDFFNKQKVWFFNSVAFKVQYKKKRIPFKLKPTSLKNWKNKSKVHFKFKKIHLKNVSNGFWSKKWMNKRITV
jgi:hypothetical protein